MMPGTDDTNSNPSLQQLLALQKVLSSPGGNAPSGTASPGTGVGPGGNGGFGGLASIGQAATSGLGMNPGTAAGVMGLAGMTGPAIGPVGTIGGMLNIAQNLGILGPPSLNANNVAQGNASIAAQGYHNNTISNPVVNSPEFNAVVAGQHGTAGSGISADVGAPGGGNSTAGGAVGVGGQPGAEGVAGGNSAGDAAAAAAAAASAADGEGPSGDWAKGGMVGKPPPGSANPPGPDDQYGGLKTGERVLSRHEVMMLGGPMGIEKLLRKARG